jgi:hypothetical protein
VMRVGLRRHGAKEARDGSYLRGELATGIALPEMQGEAVDQRRRGLAVQSEGERPAGPGAAPRADGDAHPEPSHRPRPDGCSVRDGLASAEAVEP